jgi:hypothetical protein
MLMLIPDFDLFRHSGRAADISEAYHVSIFRVEVIGNMYSGKLFQNTYDSKAQQQNQA